MSFLRELLSIPRNIRRLADSSERIAQATEALKHKYASPAPPDPRYTARAYPSDK